MNKLNILNEDSRNDLLQRSKRGKPEKTDGKTRYEKRVKSKIVNSVRNYNNINMDKLFKEDIITLDVPVVGETDNYHVKISFSDFLERLKRKLKDRKIEKIELRDIIRSLVESFDSGKNVYIYCTCPDWHYRMAFWATVNKINSGPPENIRSDITNPNDDLGPGCKHSLLVLSNSKWIIKLASVIYNYINYMKEHREQLYADIIYPALFDKKYEKDVQMDIFGDEAETDQDTIDKANQAAVQRGRFQKGNTQGIRFASGPDKK